METAQAALQNFGWWSVAPAVITILLALLTKRVVESLLTGVALGAWVVDYYTNGLLHSVLYFVPNTFMTLAGHPATETLKGMGMTKNSDAGALILGVFLIGSFMTVLERSGGAYAFADRVSKRVKGEAGALMTSWFIGLSIFTSAYFSILVTGTMMRPVFDRMKISREKLSFYCDAMSAPTKAFIPVSGWIAFMAILIEDNIPTVMRGEGIAAFIRTMPFNFYCMAMPLFVLLLSLGWIRDFGPMRRAEFRIKKEGHLHWPHSTPMISTDEEERSRKLMRSGSVSDMVVPLFISIVALLGLGMWNSYFRKWWPSLPKLDIGTMEIMNEAFAFGIIAAIIKYVSKGLMKFTEAMDCVIEGGKGAIIGAVVIIMAVTLGDLMKNPSPEGLGTAPFLVGVLKPFIVAAWIPGLTFLISCLLSFATGSSWGTWAIMMPISVPLAIAGGMNPFIVAGAVLSGGAFGDHCSPISDTTVLSSLAANTDHVEHIRTQIPYAFIVAGVCLVFYFLIGFLFL